MKKDIGKIGITLKPRYYLPIAVISVSFAAIFIRFSGSHPITIAFYRMLFSTLILSLFLPSYLKILMKLSRKEYFILMTTGLFLALHFAAWISSLDYTTVASSVVIVTAHPLIVAWVSGWYLNEKTTIKSYIGIFIALFGVGIMAFSDYRTSRWSLYGDMLALIGMLAIAGYILRGRKMRKRIPILPYAFLVYLFSTIFLGLFSFIFGETVLQVYPPREYLLFFALALIPTIFGHTVYNYVLEFVEAKIVSISLLGEPIGASILAFIILKEVPPELTIIGATVTLGGIYLCSK